MTAETLLSTLRAMGADVYLSDAGDVVVDGAPMLLRVIQWRLDEVGRPALVTALKAERDDALARIHARRAEVTS